MRNHFLNHDMPWAKKDIGPVGNLPAMDGGGGAFLCSAFDDQNFDPQGQGTKGAIKIATYQSSADTLATIEVAAYFSNTFVSTTMVTDDLIVVNGSDGHRVYKLTVSGTTVTITRITGLGSVATGFIMLDIASLREIISNDIGNAANATAIGAGGMLAQDTTPVLERINDATDKALRVNWASSNSDEVQFGSIPKPPDMDTATDFTIHLLALMAGDTDTPTIDVQVWDGIGDTEMGGVTGALSDALAEVTVTIANANVAAAPGVLNIGLVPGAHTTDALFLLGAWIEYTRLN